jgi:hypothetical protein
MSAIEAPQVVTHVNEFTRSEDPAPVAGSIQFMPTISSNTVKLQYKHDFPMDVTFKAVSRRWLSF